MIRRRTLVPAVLAAACLCAALVSGGSPVRAQGGGAAPAPATPTAPTTPAPTTPGTAPAPAPAAPRPGSAEDGIAAVVNDEAILRSEVDEQLYLFLQQNRVQPDSLQVVQLRKDILDRLIDEKVIVSEAKRLNVTVNDAEVQKSVDDAINEAKQRMGSDEAFAAELKKEGLTEADLRKKYKEDVSRQMLANQLLRKQLGNKADVTPAEAQQYFTQHPEDFPKRPAAIRVQLVQVPVEVDSVQKNAARKKAAAARARILKGEPFSRVAQELSEDPGTQNNGGDLGWFKRGTLDSTFEKAAFALPVGQVSGIVETPFGYHIIKVEEADKAKGEIHARHIVFRVTPTDADVERARKKILDVRAQAVKGVDFGTLARRYSKYKGPAGPDGDLGELPMTVFSPDFRAALDTLEIGQVSEPLLNPQGWHIFKVNDREAERAYKLDEVKDDLPDFVRQAKMKKQYEAYVAELRKKASIEYR